MRRRRNLLSVQQMSPGPFQPDLAGKCSLDKRALLSPCGNSWSLEGWKLPQLSWELVGARAKGMRSTVSSGKSTAHPSNAWWMGHRKTGLRLVWESGTKGNPEGKMALIYREMAWLAFLGTEQLSFLHGISPGYTVEHTSCCLEWSQWQYWILNQRPLLESSISFRKNFSLFWSEPWGASAVGTEQGQLISSDTSLCGVTHRAFSCAIQTGSQAGVAQRRIAPAAAGKAGTGLQPQLWRAWAGLEQYEGV